MPPTGATSSIIRTLEDVVASTGDYSIEAFYLIQEGIQRAEDIIHGPPPRVAIKNTRHVTGQQLCHALREIALERWGLAASAVLGVWGINNTMDFGRIVFALIDAGLFQKTSADSIEDFLDVYDFRKAFGRDYVIRLPERIV